MYALDWSQYAKIFGAVLALVGSPSQAQNQMPDGEPSAEVLTIGEGGLIYSPGGTILFGEIASAGDFPAVVRLSFTSGNEPAADVWQVRSSNICTGTLIHPQVILTALHCAVDDAGNLESYLRYGLREFGPAESMLEKTQGLIELSTENTAWQPAGIITETIATEGKVSFETEFDLIAILLPEPVAGAELRVALLSSENSLSEYDLGFLVGYGVSENDDSLRDLRHLSLGRLPEERLGGTRIFIRRPVVTTDGRELASGVCGGDSGGPLFMLRSTGLKSDVRLLGVIQSYTRPEPLPDGWIDMSAAEQCSYVGRQSVIVNLLEQGPFLQAAFTDLGIAE